MVVRVSFFLRKKARGHKVEKHHPEGKLVPGTAYPPY